MYASIQFIRLPSFVASCCRTLKSWIQRGNAASVTDALVHVESLEKDFLLIVNDLIWKNIWAIMDDNHHAENSGMRYPSELYYAVLSPSLSALDHLKIYRTDFVKKTPVALAHVGMFEEMPFSWCFSCFPSTARKIDERQYLGLHTTVLDFQAKVGENSVSHWNNAV